MQERWRGLIIEELPNDAEVTEKAKEQHIVEHPNVGLIGIYFTFIMYHDFGY